MAMITTTPQKSNLLGGIVLCAFPAIVFFVAHDTLRMPWWILFALFFFYGLWTVASSLFRLDSDGALSWLVGAVGAAGFAVFVFWMAFDEQDFGGGIPFIPHAWNQSIARGLVQRETLQLCWRTPRV
ncbi:MAG: hypothetical protein AB9869_18085 [Verrucomicrobiia bacterium]